MIFRAFLFSIAFRYAGLVGLLAMAAMPAAAAEVGANAAPELSAVLALPRIDPTAVESVYAAAVLRDGSVDATVARLEAIAQDETGAKHQRAQALFLASHLQWRFGRMPAALTAVNRALAIESSGEMALYKARLLEAAGNLPEARRWYGAAAALLTDPAAQDEVRLRLTFLATDTQNVGALVKLAKARDRDFRNRAAVALAILNHPAEAADLYEVFGEGAELQRRHLRLAQWALAAGRAGQAQAEAWAAVQGATLARDVRYSLSVLVEAHELDASWEKLLARFATVAAPGPDLQAVRLDVLRKLGRFDEAIALIEQDRSLGTSAEGQRRLLRMYREAGRTDTMTAAFRKLIAQEPAEVAWPRSLSEYYLEEGRREDAAAVWRDFTARNTVPGVLLDGGRAMIQLGLDDLALAAADRCLAVDPASAVQVQWYRFEFHVKRGATARAEAVLRELDRALPAAAPDRVALANAYERIKRPSQAIEVWEGLDRQAGGLGLDDKMRLAWLYDTVGRRDAALAVWRQLWAVAPESRRRLVEDRLLLLAAEAGTIGDLAVGLEEKLAAGQAAARDSSLLIRIYTDAGDSASAIEVIQEYYNRQARTPELEIASLQEQARVYRSLGKQSAFIRTTERLLALDPANRTDYLQALILSHLERAGKDDREQVKRRLADLREASVAADDEFASGVLVMAGLKDQAIDSYRRALARNPGHTDNYLLLADLLRQNRRIDEGVALLQYFAEVAPGDDGFMVAIDGILNLKPGSDSGAVRWAQRRVLERITRHDDKYYLYELAGELAEEAKDTPTYLAALENSLVDAGPRRSSVLRELASATEPKSDNSFGSQNSPPPDLRRNLAFSRRLIALGEEMPPEVYLNLGRTFLRLGDPGEALQAFNLAIDRTDRSSLVEESADRFDEAGYGREAAALYAKALTADADSVSLRLKLANVRSRDGLAGPANQLYVQALLALAAQQPVEVEGAKPVAEGDQQRPAPGEENFNYLYRNLHWNLETGILFTLAPETLPALEAAYGQALAEAAARLGGTRTAKPLGNFPRLNALAGFVRRAALRLGRYETADRCDLQLLRYFGGDTKFVTELVGQRMDWGLRASAELLRTAEGVTPKIQVALAGSVRPGEKLAALTELPVAARTALAEKKFDQAASLALAAGDPDLALTAYQEWLADRIKANQPAAGDRVAARRLPSANAGIMLLGGSSERNNLTPLVASARRKLDATRFAAFSRQLIAQAADNPDLATDLLCSGVGRDLFQLNPEKSALSSLEQAAGARLFTADRLSALIATLDARRLAALDQDYAMSLLSPAGQVELFLRIVKSSPPTTPVTADMSGLANILARPLDPALGARVTAALEDRLQAYVRANPPFGAMNLARMLPRYVGVVIRKLDRTNTGVLLELDRFLLATYPENFSSGVFKGALVKTEGGAMLVSAVAEGALLELANVPAGQPEVYATYRLRSYLLDFAEQLYPARKAEVLALLEKKAEEPAGLTPALFQVTQAIYANDPQGKPEDVVPWLERVRQRQPANRLVLEALAGLYRRLGDTDAEIATLGQLIPLAPGVDQYPVRLAEIWRDYDHPGNMLEALGGRPRKLAASADDAAATGLMFARPQSPQIKQYVAQLSAPGDEKAARAALHGLLQALPPSGGRFYFRSSIDFAGLFDLNLAAAPAKPAAADFTLPLLPWLALDHSELGEPGRPVKLLDAVLARDFAVEELEAAFRPMEPTVDDYNEDQNAFYPLLADAYAAGGRLPEEFARLTAVLQAGQAGKKDMLLWMELAIRQPPGARQGLPAVAEKVLPAMGRLDDYQRIQLARLYARAGRREQAVGIYSVAAAAVFAGNSPRYSRSEKPPLFSVLGLLADAAQYLDAAGVGQLVAQLAQIAKPPGGPGMEQAYQGLLLQLAQSAMAAGVAPDGLPAVLAAPDSPQATRDDLIRYAHYRSRTAAPEQALPALRAALARMAPPAGNPMSAQNQSLARYLQNLGLRSGGYYPYGNVPTVPAESAVLKLKNIFPAQAGTWPGARAWVEQSARAIPGWIAAGEVDPDLALQVLSLLVLRQQQLDLPGAAASARELSRLLAQAGRLAPLTARIAVAVTDQTGTPLASATVRKLVAARLLDVRQLAGQLRRTAASEGAAAALTLGALALPYTQNDAFLGEMETLARQAHDEEQLTRILTIRAEAAAARAVLAGGKAPAAPVRLSV